MNFRRPRLLLIASIAVLAVVASACASGGDEVTALEDAQSRTISQLHDEVFTLEDEVSTLKARLDEETNRTIGLDHTIEIQDELIEQINEDRDRALADLVTAEKEAAKQADAVVPVPDEKPPATAASTPTTTVPDNTQWCLDYKLSLEVFGEERARNTLVSPFDPNAYHYTMNQDHSLPLEGQGPIPGGGEALL